jgi:hypothetical protein
MSDDEHEQSGFVIEFVYAGDPDEVNDWCFSFGPDHVHPETGVPLSRRFVCFRQTTWRQARVMMYERFRRKWSSQYRGAECAEHAAKYGWRELPEAVWPAVQP